MSLSLLYILFFHYYTSMTINDFEYRKELDKLKLYQPGKSIEAVKKEFNCETIIKCASNENPLGCPLPSDVLMDLLKSIHYYPDSANHDITTALQNIEYIIFPFLAFSIELHDKYDINASLPSPEISISPI